MPDEGAEIRSPRSLALDGACFPEICAALLRLPRRVYFRVVRSRDVRPARKLVGRKETKCGNLDLTDCATMLGNPGDRQNPSNDLPGTVGSAPVLRAEYNQPGDARVTLFHGDEANVRHD